MDPLADELVVDSCGARLEGEARAEQLQAQPRGLRDDRGVVAVPPATPEMQVLEATRQHRCLVLVSTTQDGEEKLDSGLAPAELGKGFELRGTEAITSESECRIHIAASAHTDGEGQRSLETKR